MARAIAFAAAGSAGVLAAWACCVIACSVIACSVILCCGLTGCGAAPRAFVLRYEARPTEGWREVAPDRFVATALGAEVTVALTPGEASIEVVVANPTERALELRVGPEATRSKTEPIGEIQHRRLDGSRGEGHGDYDPYLSQQPVQVQPGTRTVVWLDRALGRAPEVGQYMVLLVELQAPTGPRQRRLLPVQVVGARAGVVH